MNWRMRIIERLERFRLMLHEDSAYPKPVTKGIPFLGFQIFPDHRRLKARKGYAFRRRFSHLTKTARQEKVDASIRGWINHVRHGDTFGLRRSVLNEFGMLSKERAYGG